jgi:hypothetical protein
LLFWDWFCNILQRIGHPRKCVVAAATAINARGLTQAANRDDTKTGALKL